MDPITLLTIGSALIGGIGSIFGANAQKDAAAAATKAQTKAGDKTLALQEKIFKTQQDNAKPWLESGKTALAEIDAGIADGSFDISKYGYDELIQDPGYQFRVEQGSKALDRTAAARGNLISGDQLIAANDYGQQAGSQEFDNAFRRTASERDMRYNILAGRADAGLSAANAMSGAASNFSSQASSTLMNQGNAIAQGAINQGNATAGMWGDIAQSANTGIENYILWDRLKPPPPQPIAA